MRCMCGDNAKKHVTAACFFSGVGMDVGWLMAYNAMRMRRLELKLADKEMLARLQEKGKESSVSNVWLD